MSLNEEITVWIRKDITYVLSFHMATHHPVQRLLIRVFLLQKIILCGLPRIHKRKDYSANAATTTRRARAAS